MSLPTGQPGNLRPEAVPAVCAAQRDTETAGHPGHAEGYEVVVNDYYLVSTVSFTPSPSGSPIGGPVRTGGQRLAAMLAVAPRRTFTFAPALITSGSGLIRV